MAAPAFGFSAGDFISAVNIIIDVSKALKVAGGASDEFRSLVAELDLLQNTLKNLQFTETGTASQLYTANPITAYAKQQADLTLSTLSDFLSFISKFDAKLGPQGRQAWYRGAGRKAQWALVYAKEVEKLRLRVGTQLHTLSLLLQLETRQRYASLQSLGMLDEISPLEMCHAYEKQI